MAKSSSPTFVDRVVLHMSAGNGGNGCVSVHREKFKPLGGPDGGNGGNGGDVILVVDPAVHTLLDFHYRPHAKASNGRPGMGSNRNGANGETLELRVPNGTVVYDADGEPLIDLVGAGTTFVAAHGGKGGLGNAALASTRRKAPGFALLGEEGETRDVVLELKSIADVGLVGYPSAGKSSLISVISAARPKIADYPFTTLTPNLGVVNADGMTFTVADVPGLIPGAAQGKGLGLEFLRHIERCAVLVHVVDTIAAEPDRDPVADIAAIESELAEYGMLEDRPRVVALNKIDVPDGRAMAELMRADVEKLGWPVFEISTATHEGLTPLIYELSRQVAEHRVDSENIEPPRVIIRPTPIDDTQFTITPDRSEAGGFKVAGNKPERWVRQTDFNNSEAVGFLADRLAKLGVEDALAKAGAQPGAPVTIGGVTFDWEPTITAGDYAKQSRRGSDLRIEEAWRLQAERAAKPTDSGEDHIVDPDDQE